MGKRIVGLMLSLLLMSALMLTFNIKFSKTEPTASPAPMCPPSMPNKLNFNRNEDLPRLDWQNEECTELVVGVDIPKSQMQEFEEIILGEGGTVTDTISCGENVHAFTIKVPTNCAHILIEKLQKNVLVKYVEVNAKAKALYTPNDPDWSFQWGPRKIEAGFAWNTTTGSSDILVAIVDTGIDYRHRDLAANYVSLGYDWVNDDADPMDDHGHGTHCAGIVAAKINNNIGIAGLAQARIMAEKVLTSGGWGYYSWIAEGIYHATDAGARIISMSFGGKTDSFVIHDALKYAYERGVLLVAAAGNEGNDEKLYPAAYDEVLAVTATDSSDALASFSSFGDWVELSAPGVDIYSTLPGNTYDSWSGTSMACPHVAGVAALVWSRNVSLTSAVIGYILKRTADDLGAPGFDDYYGYGRVNARKAVMAVQEHEICITEWQYPHRITPGQLGIFNATISNFGCHEETDVSLQFFVNNNLIDSKKVSLLKIGASAHVSFSWSTTILGKYKFTCYAVPVAGENVTENNVVTSVVSVRYPAVLRVPAEYQTVKLALNNASNGDIILVSEGYYAEGQINIFEDGVSLMADGHVVLDGQESRNVLNIHANHVFIEGFEIRNGSGFGVNMQGYNNTFSKNNVNNNTDGIRLYKSTNSTIILNNVTTMPDFIAWWFRRCCLFIDRSSHCVVSQNMLKGGALWLYHSESNVLTSNRVADSNFGLVIEASPYNTLRMNSMVNNTRNFSLWKFDAYKMTLVLNTPEQAVNDIDASNTVNGKPVYYWVNVHNKVVPSDTGCVVLIYCRNITVEYADISNNLNGILLLSTNDTKISRNNVNENTGVLWDWWSAGITLLFASSNNIITQNNLTSNEQSIWIEWGGSNNTVSMNTITNNWQGFALFVNSQSCTVTSNNLTYVDWGMCIDGANNTAVFNNIIGAYQLALLLSGEYHIIKANSIDSSHSAFGFAWLTHSTIVLNNITRNGGSLFLLYSSSYNRIFHNNFINNTGPPASFVYESWNTWDNGYPSGGNYWSDYTGVDLKSGSHQIAPGSDGIGDTPYIIDVNNQDRYPLMKPYALIGDLDADMKVDMKDVAIAASAFGSYPDDPRWNPKADINRDNKIDMKDIAIIAKNFGKC